MNRICKKGIWITFLVIHFSTIPHVAMANLCADAAREAAEQIEVPSDVLLALTRTETGMLVDGSVQSWPWAVNVSGKGYWFSNKSEAVSFVKEKLESGLKNFDVGYFQINYRWHGGAFRSIDEMFDPFENSFYAATFLKDIKSNEKTWIDAAGIYHSRTPKFQTRYKIRYEEVFRKVQKENHDFLIVKEKPNRYPLLQKNRESVSRGSLFSSSVKREQFLPRSGVQKR